LEWICLQDLLDVKMHAMISSIKIYVNKSVRNSVEMYALLACLVGCRIDNLLDEKKSLSFGEFDSMHLGID